MIDLENGGRALLDTSKDTYLGGHSTRQGNGTTGGTYYYLHKTAKGKNVFYVHVWSLWVGDTNALIDISEETAFRELQEIAKEDMNGLDEKEIEKIWSDFFNEV
jgi:hypothetical protein